MLDEGPAVPGVEWHEQVARQIQEDRWWPLRIEALVGLAALSAVVLGLSRKLGGDLGLSTVGPISSWVATAAFFAIVGKLGLVGALGLGRASTSLYRRGDRRGGTLGQVEKGASVLVDLAAIVLLMGIAVVASVVFFVVLAGLVGIIFLLAMMATGRGEL